ncbi:MAG: S16 family serine protease, partial [Psychrobacillus psychrodurans]
IICPSDNERDIEDIPESVREVLTFHFVSDAEEVLQLALEEA